MKQFIILLVDDQPEIRLIWKRFLSQRMECEFREASNIEEAIEQMKKIPPPDLALVDMKMPPMTPAETVLALQQLSEFNPNLRRIAISGMERDELEKLVHGVSIEAHVTKQDIRESDDLVNLVVRVMREDKTSTQDLLALIKGKI